MNPFKTLSPFALLGVGLLATNLPVHAEPADWPNNTGHNFVAPASDDLQLTNDPLNIRPLWSVDIHTGIGKAGGGSVMEVLEAGMSPTYGGTSSPVVHGGVVIQSWSQASGEIEAAPDSLSDRYFSDSERNENFRGTFLRIDADWHTIAFDIDTGEKVWETIEPSAAMNFQGSKRGHNGFNPAAANGVYVTISFTGHVFAYDVSDGSLLWSTDIGEWHERALEYKAEMLASRTLPSPGSGPFGYDRSGAAIVGDAVLVPDAQGGLLALNLSDGEKLWHLPDTLNNPQTPRSIEVDGRTMVLSLGESNGRTLNAIDPASGEILWTHKTGQNREQLILGEGVVVLNQATGGRDPWEWAAYEVTSEGLNKLWEMPKDDDQFTHGFRRARANERRAVIADGVLYTALGHNDADRRVMSFDLQSGKLLHLGDTILHNNSGHPVVHGNMMYWQIDSSHSGPSGLVVFELKENGEFTRLGDVTYRSLSISLLTDYEHPVEVPFVEGRAFVRGRMNFNAVDLRVPAHGMVDFEFKDLWAGFHRPVEARFFANEDGELTQGSLESPPRYELGVVGTSAWRDDPWMPVHIEGDPQIGSAFTAESVAAFRAFSYPITITMEERDGDQWSGRWTREFPGWEEPLTHEGHLHETSEGGFARRGWPTGWLEHQPVTFFSELEEGQERIFLQVHDFLPTQNGDFRNVTICLDHDREKVISAVGGGFSFNQSYHEIDVSELEVDENGIRGTAYMILNSDGWVHADYRNETSLLGRIHLDVEFGEPNSDGIYPITGNVSAEWGLQGQREGEIKATIQ